MSLAWARQSHSKHQYFSPGRDIALKSTQVSSRPRLGELFLAWARLSRSTSNQGRPASSATQTRREVLQLSPRRDGLAWARLAESPHCHTRILPKTKLLHTKNCTTNQSIDTNVIIMVIAIQNHPFQPTIPPIANIRLKVSKPSSHNLFRIHTQSSKFHIPPFYKHGK